MKGVFLDKKSLDIGDIDFSDLESTLPEWQYYDVTTDAQVKDRIGDAEVVLTNKVVIDESIINLVENVKLICVTATGTNNVNLAAARKRNIAVCNVRAYATPSVVQHVFTLVLALTRKLDSYHVAAMDGRWAKSEQFCWLAYPIRELAGLKIGIVGYGELGKAVAEIARAFGMDVLVAQRAGNSVMQADRIPLDDLLPQVDILSLHCPLTDDTRNLIGVRELALMKQDALLINTARGGIVNEQALVDALCSGKLGGAGVDVLSEEPPRHGNALLDKTIPNLIVTPHIAWASRESRQRLVNQVADSIRSFLRGNLKNRVV